MYYQFSANIIPHFVSLIIVISLAIYGYKHRDVKASLSFTFCMAFSFLWVLSYMMGIAAVNVETKFFWSNVQYIAFAFCPLIWLIMVIQFIDKKEWLSKKNLILMSIIPFITSILAWFDKSYGLLRHEYSLNPSGIYPITQEFGSWFTVHYIYSYILLFTAIILLINTVMKKNSTFKKQSLFLLIGFLIILAADILFISNIIHLERIIIDPIVFYISGAIFWAGIFYFQIFDIVPVGREILVEEMNFGIIVLDKNSRIIDINSQARKIFSSFKKISGKPLSYLSEKLNQYIGDEDYGLIKKEFEIDDREGKTHYHEVYISSLDKDNSLSAWLLVINDITDLKEANEQIKKHIQELAVMKERERMARELHDNLGHILSFSDIQLQASLKKLKNKQYKLAEDYLKKLNNIIKEAHKEVREYVYNMRNDIDNEQNFEKILKRELKIYKKERYINIELAIEKDLNLDFLGVEEKFHLLNIIKEAINNTLKHAEAENICISLKRKNDKIELSIVDDGKGIENFSIETGSGLSIMNERAVLISGKLKIESELNKGTKIQVILNVGSEGTVNNENNDS